MIYFASMFRLWAALLVAVSLLGCGKKDPNLIAWPVYSDRVKLILAEYDQAMNEVGDIDIKLTPVQQADGKVGAQINPQQAIERIEKEVIPRLQRAKAMADGLKTPNAKLITQIHATLATSLALKLDGYVTMVAAFRGRDPQKYDQGIQKLTSGADQLGSYRKIFSDSLAAGGPVLPK